MFCPNCGNVIADNSAFCTVCGATLNGGAPTQAPVPPVQVPVAPQAPVQPDYNQVPNPAYAPTQNVQYAQTTDMYNNQGVVYTKKPKNKLVTIIISIVVAIIVGVGGYFAITLITAEDYKEVAKNYALAQLEFDYDGIKDRVSYDIDELAYDSMIKEYMEDDDLSEDEAFDKFKDEAKENGVKISDKDDVFEKVCEFKAKMIKENNSEFEAEVKDSEKLDKDEIKELIEDLKDNLEEIGLDIEDYMDTDISEAYEVTVSYVRKDNSGEMKNTMSFTVVKDGLKWKVLDFPF